MTSPTAIRSPWNWLGFAATLGIAAFALMSVPLQDVAMLDADGADWRSMLPPLVAVFFAIWFRQLVPALALAVVAGAFLAFGPQPGALVDGAREFIVAPVSNPFNAMIIAFTVVLVGMVRVMSRSGGNAGIVARIVRRGKGLRSTRLTAALMGLVFFFDDYANTVVVGTTMRPLTDRMRIAREKLAYIVDSTAAPVAGLAVISTWVAFEVGLFQELSDQEGLGLDGYAMLLAVLPFRFYCLAALFFVFSGVLTRRDFGPMWRAERRAFASGALWAAEARPLMGHDAQDEVAGSRMSLQARNAILPIVAVVFGVVAGTLYDARESIRDAVAAGEASWSPLSAQMWGVGFAEANSAQVLLTAALFGTLVAVGLALRVGVPARTCGGAWLRGAWSMRLAVTILVLAWGIKEVCDALGTSEYLIALVGDGLTLTLLPVVTFVLAGAIAFATGTSWGTMAILIPVVIPLAVALGSAPGSEVGALFLFLTGAAVLDGAIFGDHVSPISDTTVLSSTACGCDHLDHVRTQAPYALCAMLGAGLFGYLGVAHGLSWWAAMIALALVAFLVMRLVGRPIASESDERRFVESLEESA